MENMVLNLTYTSSLTDLCEINSSFDSGILKIAYPGKNRNSSSITKEVFKKCLKTIYNCPVVCNYDRESDTLGGHDMALVSSDDGSMRIVNLTHPVGVIPQGAKVFWETVEEEDGTSREYLCAEALIWKRQEAYKKIKEDGIVAQSMEITIKDGKSIDGIYHIYDFEFTAFALIGCEPCFESASLSFSKQEYKNQFTEMMLELKECFSQVYTSVEDDNIHQDKYSTEGGTKVLNKQELIEKYNIDTENLDFSIDDFTEEELEEKFKAMSEGSVEPTPANDNADKFELASNTIDEIANALASAKIIRDWGEYPQYSYADCDTDAKYVYAWDRVDWLLYGFSYELNGDSVEIDFESKKRMKYAIVEFDEGEQVSPFVEVFSVMEQRICADAELVEKYQVATDTITSMENELGELRQYKADAEKAIADAERESIFAKFEDLSGVEAFEELKNNCAEYDVETIEEKCFAIRGRNNIPAKFSMENKTPKIKVEHKNKTEEPYGGLFETYGVSKSV